MPIGLGSALWGVVLPLDETNLATNPSFEFGTAGVVAIQSATLGTSSAFQKYGAWSLIVTPNSNGTSGAYMGTWTSGNGTAYSIGAWINAAAGVPMRMAIGDGAGVNLTSGSVTFTGGGTWQWYGCGTVEAAQGTHSVVIQKTSGVSVAPFYVDGVDISPWSDGTLRSTTYSDGDQPGGTWLGAQHASISFRTGQYRGGGSIVALADLGLQVDQMLGVGMPPVENSSQSYAIVDGAQFQRTRAASRHFTLTAKPLLGTSTADFHVTRRTLIDVIKSDLVSGQQPIRLLYYGGQGTIGADCYYEKGLELGNMDGPIAEDAAISFAAYDPYWYFPTQQGTTLAPRTAIGSTNYIIKRSPLGKWGSVGQGAGPNSVVRGLALSNGTLFAGGSFTTVDGTAGGRWLAQYNTLTNTWGTLIGGTVNDFVNKITFSPSGTLFAAGSFTTVAGTAGGKFLGRWANNLFGTLQGGTVADTVNAITYSQTGTLFIGGNFTTTAGTTSGPTAIWTGAFGTLKNGSLSIASGAIRVDSVLFAADRSFYAFGTFNRAGGTAANAIARHANGTWGTLGQGIEYVAVGVLGGALAQGPNGVVYAGGRFSLAGGGSAVQVAQWNSIAWKSMGSGLGNVVDSSAGGIDTLAVNQTTGNVIAGGIQLDGTANGIARSLPSDMAQWNGYTWLPMDVSLQTTNQIFQIVTGPDNAIYVAGDFLGTAYSASVGTIVNTGRAAVYPTMRLRNLSAGSAHIYQLLNTLTGDGIFFNYIMQPSEQVQLVLTPGTRSFQSSSFGNILNSILPGSNLATWNLLPGTNYVSFFSDNDSLEASFFWGPRSWSADGGTI